MPAAVNLRTHLHYAIAAYGCEKAQDAEVSPKTCHSQVKRMEPGGRLLLRRKQMLFSILISAGLIYSGLPSGSLEPVTDTLHSVTVTADKGVVISRKDTLASVNSFSVSDILLQSPGIHIGDNGGFAGLKTVSLRGLGSTHTAVYIDGVKVGNVQSGQNDLGMIGVDNFSEVVLDYAQNSVSFNTARPSFGHIPVAGSVRLSAGSFGTYLPSARMDFRLSDKVSLSANASGVFSKGDYSYGDGSRRSNNDISQIRSGLDLWGILAGGDYHIKAYFNTAERGTPGSVSWPSDDRQKDMNAFVQARLTNRFSPLYTLNLSLKAGYDDIYYSSIYGDSNYGQTEVQLNSSHSFQITQGLKLSLAADVHWDRLNSSNYDASRLSAFSAVAASYTSGRLAANAAVEYYGAYDKGKESRNAVSPSLDVRYTAFNGFDIRAFARRAYRVPVFNELYYIGYGNPDLKPEDVWMVDLGVDFNRRTGNRWRIEAKLDAFCNWLTDKIISAPSEADPNIWQPYNIGKVLSVGYDASAGFRYSGNSWVFDAKGQYTYQSAVDRTSGSDSFGLQIPYIARHIAIFRVGLSWKGWNLSPSWQWRGGRTDGYGDLPAWNTLDVEFSKTLSLKKAGSLAFKVSARNLADCRYETVSGYPMPGRNFIGGIEYSF